MQQEAKLIQAYSLEGEKREFIIFTNHIYGKGSFGTVKKAIEKGNPYEELAVKILPYNHSKEKIEKQIQILKRIPHHPNLVCIIPLKCFSKNNFYIFMEYCNGGTLHSLMRKQISQEIMISIFYQIIKGYKVLFDSKILHQDLKPDNILIKGHNFKITDFGFSLLYKQISKNCAKEGTLPYMPLEKLVSRIYQPSVLSDVYSIGVIMFKLITKKHPYVKETPSIPDHIKQFVQNPLQLEPSYILRYSLRFQRLFQIILKMIQKKIENRIQFQDVYAFLSKDENFNCSQQKAQSQLFLYDEPSYNVTEHSQAISIPFSIDIQQQKEYIDNVEQKLHQNLELQKQQLIKKIDSYLLNTRLVVYFIDRLSRRLYIEQVKSQKKEWYRRLVLALLLLQRKIIQQLLAEALQSRVFSTEEWREYKLVSRKLLSLIRRDENYVTELITDCILGCKQTEKYEQKRLLDKSKDSLNSFIEEVKTHIFKFLEDRLSFVDHKDQAELVTICYGFDCLRLLFWSDKWGNEDLVFNEYIRVLQTNNNSFLVNKIISEAEKYKLQCLICTEEIDLNSQK